MKTLKQTAILWIVQVVVNAALLALFAYWLQWPDSNKAYLTATALTALFMVFAALWLHCGTLGCFADPKNGLSACFRYAWRRLPAFLLWVLVLAALVWGLQWLKDQLPQAAVRTAQLLHSSPRAVYKTGDCVLFAAQWIILPALLWPFAFQISGRGFRGWHPRALFFWRRGRYWLSLIVALSCGLAAPYKLLHWEITPGASLLHQKWSAGLRFSAAYLLCITAWLMLATVMSAERREKGIRQRQLGG